MADVLNSQFESVFQHENQLPLRLPPCTSPFPSMNYIHITESGMHKMLECLKPHKANGTGGDWSKDPKRTCLNHSTNNYRDLQEVICHR